MEMGDVHCFNVPAVGPRPGPEAGRLAALHAGAGGLGGN